VISLNEMEVKGTVARGFEKVRQVFAQNLKDNEVGACLAVFIEGKQVINLWGGHAYQKANNTWQEDTLANVFSCTKGITNMCVALLVDRKLLDYNQKVSAYWPEFGQNGKQDMTLTQLLSHQGGLAALDENLSLDVLSKATHGDREDLNSILVRQTPVWPLGTGFGYHVHTVGFFVNEIIRRVDPKHRSVKDFFREEIGEPFGIEFYFGLPKNFSESRVARLYQKDAIEVIRKTMARADSEDHAMSALAQRAHRAIHKFNSWNARYLEIPSSIGFSNARALAELLDALANQGVLRGKPLFKNPKIIDLALQQEIEGVCKVMKNNACFSKGGFVLYKEYDGFGHGGYGGSLAFGSQKYRMGFAYVTNNLKLVSVEDPRRLLLLNAVYECLKALPKNSLIPSKL